jgi:hypothetical protein
MMAEVSPGRDDWGLEMKCASVKASGLSATLSDWLDCGHEAARIEGRCGLRRCGERRGVSWSCDLIQPLIIQVSTLAFINFSPFEETILKGPDSLVPLKFRRTCFPSGLAMLQLTKCPGSHPPNIYTNDLDLQGLITPEIAIAIDISHLALH